MEPWLFLWHGWHPSTCTLTLQCLASSLSRSSRSTLIVDQTSIVPLATSSKFAHTSF